MHRTRDSLDAPQTVLPDYGTVRRPEPPRALTPLVWSAVAGVALVVIAGCGVFAPALWALSTVASSAIERDTDLVGGLVRITLVVGAVGACLGILGAARWVWRHADVAGVLRAPGDVPIAYTDLRRAGVGMARQALAHHYEVEGARAAASQWHGTSSYAPSISYRYDTRNEGALALPEPATGAVAPPLDAGRPVLAQLVDRGWMRSGALLAGFDSAAAPQYIDLALTGFVAIGGQARSGKTTTALSLMAQAACQGASLFICDPHARVAQGLLHRAAPLSGRFERQAVTDEEIAAVIALVAKIARRRLDGLDAADQTLLLVIDEYTALVARRALPDDALAALLAVAVEAPKVKVHGLLLAQDWSSRLLGTQLGASLRRVVTHRIVHRSDPGNADFLLPSGALARQVATLERGSALFWPADGSPIAVSVPEVGTDEDLRYAARGTPPKPYAPRPVLVAPAPARPAATPPPPQALTLAGRIKAHLADGQPRDSVAIAAELHEDKGAVQAALTKMGQAGEITRQGSARRYLYTTR